MMMMMVMMVMMMMMMMMVMMVMMMAVVVPSCASLYFELALYTGKQRAVHYTSESNRVRFASRSPSNAPTDALAADASGLSSQLAVSTAMPS